MADKQYAVFGLGQFGRAVVETLVELNLKVFICDNNAHRVQEMSQIAPYAVVIDLSDESALKTLDFSAFDVLIIAMGSNLEASITSTIYAKENGVPYIIAKVQNTLHQYILEKLGADEVLLPEREMGKRLGASLASNDIMDYIKLSEDYSIVEIKPLAIWVDKPIREAEIRNRYHVSIVAIKRNDEVIVNPHPEEKIVSGDILVVIGKNEDIHAITLEYL